MRRLLIIIAVLIVLAGLAAAAYFFIFAKSSGLVVDTTGANPFGNSAAGTSTVDTGGANGNGVLSEGKLVTQRLIEVSPGPVVPGEVVFTSSTTVPVPAQAVGSGTSTASSTAGVSVPTPDTEIRYVLRESGNLFSYLFHSHVSTRLVNKTIPGVEEASWLPTGAVAYLRYQGSTSGSSEVDTYGLPSDGSNGFFLPLNLAQIFATGPSSIFSLASGANGSIGSVSKSDGSASATAFSSPLTSITVRAAGKGQYLAYTKPSALAAGYAYAVDGAGNFTRVLGPLTGLVALPSPSGSWTLFSYTDQGTLKTGLLNMKTLESLPLPVATIADKCVWTLDETAVYCGVPATVPDATYPDDWYQGAVSFSDRIWKINVSGRFAELALDFSATANVPLDATALAIDPKNDVLVFLNKRDGSLWAYDL